MRSSICVVAQQLLASRLKTIIGSTAHADWLCLNGIGKTQRLGKWVLTGCVFWYVWVPAGCSRRVGWTWLGGAVDKLNKNPSLRRVQCVNLAGKWRRPLSLVKSHHFLWLKVITFFGWKSSLSLVKSHQVIKFSFPSIISFKKKIQVTTGVEWADTRICGRRSTPSWNYGLRCVQLRAASVCKAPPAKLDWETRAGCLPPGGSQSKQRPHLQGLWRL
jgi:hypothetical protein